MAPSLYETKRLSTEVAELKQVERGGVEPVTNACNQQIIKEILVEATGLN